MDWSAVSIIIPLIQKPTVEYRTGDRGGDRQKEQHTDEKEENEKRESAALQGRWH